MVDIVFEALEGNNASKHDADYIKSRGIRPFRGFFHNQTKRKPDAQYRDKNPRVSHAIQYTIILEKKKPHVFNMWF